jgi:NADH-quinone oxidoreductase subunit N
LVLSLAGIPVSGGFFGKLYIILGTMETQKYWLGALMIGTSVVSFYYYFGVIRQMFMRSDYESTEVKVPLPLGITVWICAAASLVLGFYPQLVLDYIEKIFSLSKDLIIM